MHAEAGTEAWDLPGTGGLTAPGRPKDAVGFPWPSHTVDGKQHKVLCKHGGSEGTTS